MGWASRPMMLVMVSCSACTMYSWSRRLEALSLATRHMLSFGVCMRVSIAGSSWCGIEVGFLMYEE